MHNHKELQNTPLGKKCDYHSQYDANLLCAISRQPSRENLGIKAELPFYGNDIWNAFELSWLDAKGKPVVAIAEIIVPCTSTNIFESKSLKLYLYSLNNSHFDCFATVESILKRDLSLIVGGVVKIKLTPVSQQAENFPAAFDGICLDNLDISCDVYSAHPDFLNVEDQEVTETVYSDLLRSNCLVTRQPDWASIKISYTGKKIQHEGLLRYIVSYRNHVEFHEQCVERIFMDITSRCSPKKLLVYARYTRRGGIDINPYRASHPIDQIENYRLFRQ